MVTFFQRDFHKENIQNTDFTVHCKKNWGNFFFYMFFWGHTTSVCDGNTLDDQTSLGSICSGSQLSFRTNFKPDPTSSFCSTALEFGPGST